MMAKKHVSFFLVVASLFLSAQAQQDMGIITGIVNDSSGATVPGAKVVATNRDTNEAVTVITDLSGVTRSDRSALGRTTSPSN